MVNTCKEFETLPVSQGNILVRGPSQSVRKASLTDWVGPSIPTS